MRTTETLASQTLRATGMTGQPGKSHQATALLDRLLNLADMIGPVAHDVKNVLNNIVLQAAGLARTIPEAWREPVGRLRALAVIAGRMLAELDRFRHQLVLVKQPVDISGIIERTVQGCRESGLQIHAELAHPLPLVQGDERDCTRLFTLLLVAAHQRAAPVSVRAASDGGDVLICVADAGPALPPERLYAFFEPFEEKADGSGNLEHAAALTIARRLGATLEATNQPDGGVGVALRLRQWGEADDPFKRS